MGCNVLINTHDGYYRQVDGLAMGSAPAPHLANGWLSSFDSLIKGDSSLYNRYMDDVLSIIEKNNIESKLNEINNLHPSLKFTIEIEVNSSMLWFAASIFVLFRYFHCIHM